MAELIQLQPQYILLWQQIGRTLIFHRWAGLSGALAIIFSVYVENCKLSNFDKHFVIVANQINYVHALILMAVPLTRRPNLVSGMIRKKMLENKSCFQEKKSYASYKKDFLFSLKTGTLFLIGMGVYCLGSYFCALINFNGYHYAANGGSIILIAAWLSLLF